MAAGGSFDEVIVAVSSSVPLAGQAARCILRLSGTGALQAAHSQLTEPVAATDRQIVDCTVRIGQHIRLPAKLYYFAAPRSYTGQEMVELHLWASEALVNALLEQFCQTATPPVRLAKPGEFTQRAFLNGKLDLMQAEAVAHLITSASQLQLTAAQQLLSGHFSQTIQQIQQALLDALCRIEAELDFSDQDIGLLDTAELAGRLASEADRLQRLLDHAVQQEHLLDLPTVGLAGLTNAGKSALFNALLATERSIVSDRPATTRDVLTEVLTLPHCQAVLFDCAGFLPPDVPAGLLDELAHQAASAALKNAALTLFCVDISQPDCQAAATVLRHTALGGKVITVATKSDLVEAQTAQQRLAALREAGMPEPIVLTSAKTGQGLEILRQWIQTLLASAPAGEDRLTLNQRHRRHLTQALEAITAAAAQLRAGHLELAALMLRCAHSALTGLEYENISEDILERIFSQFCIGK